MKIIRIKKRGSNKYRKIYVPNESTKNALKALVPPLAHTAAALDVHGVSHGFTAGRSPVTNARMHVGYQYTLCFDLLDFFDSVRMRMIAAAYPNASRANLVFMMPDGALRQGLPTSPALANIAASRMDADIMKHRAMGRFGWNFVFTRYADDLAFSFDRLLIAGWLRETIPEIVERHGFKINPEKTKLQAAQAGRRMITGVAVDNTGIHVPREIKRRLRAAQHQMRRNPWAKGQFRGLSEWARLKTPKNYVAPPSVVGTVTMVTMQVGTDGAVRSFGYFQRRFA